MIRLLTAATCLLGAFMVLAGGGLPPAATSTATPARNSQEPMLESIQNSPDGPVAIFLVRDPNGSESRLRLKKGDTIDWNSQTISILDFDGSGLIISRPSQQPMMIIAGATVTGKVVRSSRPARVPPPLNPALLALATDEVFKRSLTATGTDYDQAKAVLVSRPRESEALAKRILNTVGAPMRDCIVAQALLEEIADPKAYETARTELISVAYLRGYGLTLIGRTGPMAWTWKGITDPRKVHRAAAPELYKLLAKYPGLRGEVILKSTGDQMYPLFTEAASKELERQHDEYMRAWEADQAGPKEFGNRFSAPTNMTPESFSQFFPPATVLRCVQAEAALASAHAPDADTRVLLKTLDPQLHADVLKECERLLDTAATKPATLPGN